MSFGRDILRKEAQKVYKEKCKGVPRKNRMSFPQFFKNYKLAFNNEVKEPVEPAQDFDFNDMINSTAVEEPKIEIAEVIGQIDTLDSVSGISEAEVEK